MLSVIPAVIILHSPYVRDTKLLRQLIPHLHYMDTHSLLDFQAKLHILQQTGKLIPLLLSKYRLFRTFRSRKLPSRIQQDRPADPALLRRLHTGTVHTIPLPDFPFCLLLPGMILRKSAKFLLNLTVRDMPKPQLLRDFQLLIIKTIYHSRFHLYSFLSKLF